VYILVSVTMYLLYVFVTEILTLRTSVRIQLTAKSSQGDASHRLRITAAWNSSKHYSKWSVCYVFCISSVGIPVSLNRNSIVSKPITLHHQKIIFFVSYYIFILLNGIAKYISANNYRTYMVKRQGPLPSAGARNGGATNPFPINLHTVVFN
jgi:hypothetical protein